MELTELLRSLSEASFIIGREGAGETAEEIIREYAPGVRRDRLGSIVASVFPVRPGRPHLILDAHIDEIGFIVTRIDDGGFLRVAPVGGPDLRALPGCRASVFGREKLGGVFCCGAAGGKDGAAPDKDCLAVDIGFCREKAEKYVAPGDFVTISRRAELMPGGIMTGKALDNRAGVAAAIRVCELIAGKDPNIGFTVLLSSGEELGERGAQAAAYALDPTHALVIDTSFAHTPDAPREKCGLLGKGPMIGFSPVLSAAASRELTRIAKSRGIPYQAEIMGGPTGTDSDRISVTRGGVDTALVSVPLRYMHTACEAVAISDVENTARLAAAYILSLGGATNG